MQENQLTQTSQQVLHAFEVFGANLDEHLHLVIPELVQLFNVTDTGTPFRRAALCAVVLNQSNDPLLIPFLRFMLILLSPAMASSSLSSSVCWPDWESEKSRSFTQEQERDPLSLSCVSRKQEQRPISSLVWV